MDQIVTDILKALREFADQAHARLKGSRAAEPEAQLHAPVSSLLHKIGTAFGQDLLVQAEWHAGRNIGIPDFGVSRGLLLIGYVETKAPGTGADADTFKGRNKKQWERFQDLPNLIYTDGHEWALYQNGQIVDSPVELNGDIREHGAAIVTEANARALYRLFAEFLNWDVVPPRNAKDLAEVLAPLCRMLRDEVRDGMRDPQSPLVQLAGEWREHLFPQATDERFADAYAQTVTYALLLARGERADPLDLHAAAGALEIQHSMLARALEVMTDRQTQGDIGPALRLLQRVIARIDPDILARDGKADPWLYFYEDFLAQYDPQLRRDSGAYYTPVEVVRAQVRMVDDLLTNHFGLDLGFADASSAPVLDPAAGTGTYLLGIVDHAMSRVTLEEGEGATKARSQLLWQNLHGFEFMVSPYAVAELRLAQALKRYGARMPATGPPMYFTNSLESPHTQPSSPPLFYQPIADEHHRALQIKDRKAIRVCIGNPPYDRHEAATEHNRAYTGAWVRWGESGTGHDAPLNDYIQPAREAGHGGHLKNLYNLYVYFWRWAFWKVFEHRTSPGQGIVSYISASSYLDGDAFVGMRQHMRTICDDIYILDLGGEQRGARKDENVFVIQTPVAIAICIRSTEKSSSQTPARVHYARIEGAQAEKLDQLDQLTSVHDLEWQLCPNGWQAPFRPAGAGDFFNWPLLTDLMPWQQSGVKLGRNWPVAPSEEVLERRWASLCEASRAERSRLFVNRRTGRKFTDSPKNLPPLSGRSTPIADLPADEETPATIRYAYRTFDRQYVIADARLIDRPSPPLWGAYGYDQIYLTTLINSPLGEGPAATVSAHIPDLHHFRGSFGAKEILPLYRDPSSKSANIHPELCDILAQSYGRDVAAWEVAAYIYALLAHPGYTERFYAELETREIRVPITLDIELFEEAVRFGSWLIHLHTYGERMVPEGEHAGRIPKGAARCTTAISDDPKAYPKSFSHDADGETLIVGDGEFAPVSRAMWEFEVSGLKVLQSWLSYRMAQSSGRTSSPLDEIRPAYWGPEFTNELLNLLWILEHTVAHYAQQKSLLDRIFVGPLLDASDLSEPPEATQRAPRVTSLTLFDG